MNHWHVSDAITIDALSPWIYIMMAPWNVKCCPYHLIWNKLRACDTKWKNIVFPHNPVCTTQKLFKGNSS